MRRNNTQDLEGFSTIEMLIALALAVLVIAAVVLVSYGGQSLAEDSRTNTEALHKAQALLEAAVETSRQSYDSVVSTSGSYVNGITYATNLDVPLAYTTPCSKLVAAKVSWTGEHKRTLFVSATTTLTNLPLMLSLAGNCDTSPPGGGWNPPTTWASGNFNPGKPTALDEFKKMVYIGANKSPYLYIADTSTWTKGQTNGTFLTFSNSFDDGAQINDIKVAQYSNGKIYAFVARNSSSKQFEVIDVSTPTAPKSLNTVTLAGVSSKGTAPEGWALYYFDQKVFIVTRFTSGPELHIIDVSTPSSPVEIGSGTELGRTAEDLTVTKKLVDSTWHYYIFLATDKNSAPLSVYDVTFPTPSSANISELTTAEPTFANYQDGQSVYLLGNNLYFGRSSDPSGADLFVYNISGITSGTISLLNSADIGTSVLDMAVSGSFAFLSTSQSNNEFKVWRSDPSNFTSVNTNFNFPNLINHGIKYENNFVYVASQANDALRILYSP